MAPFSARLKRGGVYSCIRTQVLNTLSVDGVQIPFRHLCAQNDFEFGQGMASPPFNGNTLVTWWLAQHAPRAHSFGIFPPPRIPIELEVLQDFVYVHKSH